MSRTKLKRNLFNIIISIVILGGLVASGAIMWNVYKNNKIPNFYNNRQIQKNIEKDCQENAMEGYEIKNIKITYADGMESAVVTADIVKTKANTELISTCSYSYELKNDKWEFVDKEFSDEAVTWNIMGSAWSITLDDGSFYKISFDNTSEAKITLTEAHVVETKEDSEDIQEDVTSANLEVALNNTTDDLQMDENSEEETFEEERFSLVDSVMEMNWDEINENYYVVIWRPDGTGINFIITMDEVKVDLGNEKGEVILKKE